MTVVLSGSRSRGVKAQKATLAGKHLNVKQIFCHHAWPIRCGQADILGSGGKIRPPKIIEMLKSRIFFRSRILDE